MAALRSAVLAWYDAGHRKGLPWRSGERDPYRVWLAEALLQQTRAPVAAAYYLRFVARFPTLADLAAADEDEVLRLWQGLGYYRRARDLHRAVREVAERYGGRVPDDPVALRALPGVGPYTAAAVLSIAYGRPVAAVDGNVVRVLARLSAEGGPVDRPEVRRRLEGWADRLVPPDRPGAWNEALMDLGALVCRPRRPRCDACPAAPWCRGRALGTEAELPRRTPRVPVPAVAMTTVAVEAPDGRWCLVRRPPRGLLAGLWEFPTGEGPDPDAVMAELGLRAEGAVLPVGEFRHVFSHRAWHVRVFRCRAASPLPPDRPGMRWLRPEAWGDVPMAGPALRVARALLAAAGDPPGQGGA